MKKLLCILLFIPYALFGQDNYYLSFDDTDYIDLGYSPILIQPEQVSVLAKVKMNQLTGHLDSQTIFLEIVLVDRLIWVMMSLFRVFLLELKLVQYGIKLSTQVCNAIQ